MSGRFFQLISKHSGHALSSGDSTGSPLIVNNRNEKDDRQLWYEDQSSGTIRNKASHLCIHVGDDNTLYLKALEPGQDAQQWTVGKETVHHRKDNQKVLDICRSSKDAGAQVCAWKSHGGTNQLWDAVFQKPKFFYIKSELNGKVLDVEGENPNPGSKIIMWDQKKGPTAANQIWYEDEKGIIRSKLNNLSIDASGTEIVTQTFDPNNPKRNWVVNGSFVSQLSDKNIVLDIIRSNPDNGAQICAYKQHGGPNQKWKLEPAE